MERQDLLTVILAAAIVIMGIFLAVKGNPKMIRERFASGVSPENERKFMLTIGGGIVIIGLDMMILAILEGYGTLSRENILIILSVGLALFAAVITYGQKHYRR